MNNRPSGGQATAPAQPTKTPWHTEKENTDDDSSSTAIDLAAAPTTAGAQPAPSPAPPAVAVTVANADQGSAQTPANTSAPIAIGGQSKGHTKASLAAGGDQNVATGPTATDVPGAQTTSAKQTNNAAGTPSDPSDGGKAKAANTTSTQDTPAQSAAASSTAAPPDGWVATDPGSGGPRIAAPSTAPSSGTAELSNAQTSANAAKPDTAGLPSFGFTASAATAASNVTDVAPADTNAAPAVPIAGLAVAIAARAQAGSHQFDIRLDPPELGRIDVRLDVDPDGQVTTHVTADRADTLQLLQTQQPQIQQALEQAGLKTTDNGLQFTLRDQSFAGQNNGSGAQQNSGSSPQLVIPDSDLPSVSATQIYSRAGVGSGVDIRV